MDKVRRCSLRWFCVAVVCGVSCLSLPALAADGVSPYIGIYGGMAFPEDLSNVEGRGSLSGISFSDFDLKSGPLVGVKLGISGSGTDSLMRWFGLELDVSYLRSKIKQQTLQASAGGLSVNFPVDATNVHLITGAAHVLLKYPDGPFQPYLGVGPAAVHGRVSDSATFSSASTTALGLSAVGGLRVLLSEHIGFFAEYKHIRAGLEFEDVEGDVVVHGAVGGVNFVF